MSEIRTTPPAETDWLSAGGPDLQPKPGFWFLLPTGRLLPPAKQPRRRRKSPGTPCPGNRRRRVFLPSPSEIAAETARMRREWTPEREEKRRARVPWALWIQGRTAGGGDGPTATAAGL